MRPDFGPTDEQSDQLIDWLDQAEDNTSWRTKVLGNKESHTGQKTVALSKGAEYCLFKFCQLIRRQVLKKREKFLKTQQLSELQKDLGSIETDFQREKFGSYLGLCDQIDLYTKEIPKNFTLPQLFDAKKKEFPEKTKKKFVHIENNEI